MAVLALDMSSFSLAVRRNGVRVASVPDSPHAACSPSRSSRPRRRAAEVRGRQSAGGVRRAGDAVAAAVAINRAVAEHAGSGRHNVPPLAVSIGIDFGKLLVLPGEDCFGDAVNVAHKLGEDVAGPGEVLITGRVREQLGAEPAANSSRSSCRWAGSRCRRIG